MQQSLHGKVFLKIRGTSRFFAAKSLKCNDFPVPRTCPGSDAWDKLTDNRREMGEQPIKLGRKRGHEADPEPHVDPVCKMLVLPGSAAANYEGNG